MIEKKDVTCKNLQSLPKGFYKFAKGYSKVVFIQTGVMPNHKEVWEVFKKIEKVRGVGFA